jgi:hypothetical protein
MISTDSRSVIDRAKSFYDEQLRNSLEKSSFGKFITIEPASGRYFMGDTFDESVDAALNAMPDQLTFTLQVGQKTAIHLGGQFL